MKEINKETCESVQGGWFLPVFQAVLGGVGVYIGAHEVASATQYYNSAGAHLGEWAFTKMHPDSEVLGQMYFEK